MATVLPIAQSEPTVSTILACTEVLPGRHAQARRRLAEVAELNAVLGRKLGHLGIVAQELVEPVLDVQPGGDRLLQEPRQAGGN